MHVAQSVINRDISQNFIVNGILGDNIQHYRIYCSCSCSCSWSRGDPYDFCDMVGDRDVPHIYFSLDVNIRYKAFSACKAQSGAVSILVNRITDNYCLKIITSVYV